MKKYRLTAVLALLVFVACFFQATPSQAMVSEEALEEALIEQLLAGLPPELDNPIPDDENMPALWNQMFDLRKNSENPVHCVMYAKPFEPADLAKDGAVLLLGKVGRVVKELPLADIHLFETEIDGQKQTVLLQRSLDVPLRPGYTALVAAGWAEGRYVVKFGPSGVFTGTESELRKLRGELLQAGQGR